MIQGHVVEEYKIGNTVIKIADDCIIRDHAKVEKLLREIAETAYRHINSAIVTEKIKKEEML